LRCRLKQRFVFLCFLPLLIQMTIGTDVEVIWYASSFFSHVLSVTWSIFTARHVRFFSQLTTLACYYEQFRIWGSLLLYEKLGQRIYTVRRSLRPASSRLFVPLLRVQALYMMTMPLLHLVMRLDVFLSENWWRAVTIDYRCEDGRIPLSASCVTISNPVPLSGSETGVNLGIRSWKSAYLNELDVRKSLVVSILQRSEELRLHNLV
jgi:hypothetical protein